MNSWTLSLKFTDLAYADDAAILTSDQLQEDISYHGPRQNSKTWVQVTRRRKSS